MENSESEVAVTLVSDPLHPTEATKEENGHPKDFTKEENGPLEGLASEDQWSSIRMVYKVQDVPPFHVTLLLALQQVIMTIPASLTLPLLLAEILCAEDPAPVRAKLCGISLFLCGLATVLQCTLGIRLPIIQGGSHTFLPPVLAMLALDRWRCPQGPQEDPDEAWMMRMREIQGNLILASLTQVVLGCTGLLGFLMRFIGPLTVAPTIALIGLSLTNVITMYCQVQWGLAVMTVVLVLIFSFVLGRYRQPCPSWNRQSGCHVTPVPLLQLFAMFAAMVLMWMFCIVLTVTDVLPNNSTSVSYRARTDIRMHVLHEAPWFSLPYPFQFGMPTVSAAGYVGMLSATLCSVVESVGDYFAAARAGQAPPPPSSAVNRGVAAEGVASIFSGMLGAGHPTTSYSGMAGAMMITKVASRRVFQIAGLILMLCGLMGKLGAVVSLIPDPIVGGSAAVILSLVSALGVSIVLHANMATARNMAIFGLSVTMGLAVPQWITGNPGAIDTGNTVVDQTLGVLLGTPMFVGGFLGCFLDNTLPGTLAERGILTWGQKLHGADVHDENEVRKVYDIPYVSKLIRKIPFCSYVPISPSFREKSSGGSGLCNGKRKSSKQDGGEAGNVRVNGFSHEMQDRI